MIRNFFPLAGNFVNSIICVHFNYCVYTLCSLVFPTLFGGGGGGGDPQGESPPVSITLIIYSKKIIFSGHTSVKNQTSQ